MRDLTQAIHFKQTEKTRMKDKNDRYYGYSGFIKQKDRTTKRTRNDMVEGE